MVEEVDGRIRFVARSGHEEGGRGTEGHHSIHGAQRKGKDRSGIVAGERGDSTGRAKTVSLYKVGRDAAQSTAAVFRDRTKLAFEFGGTRGSGRQGYKLLVPIAGFYIPEIHPADIGNIAGCNRTEED